MSCAYKLACLEQEQLSRERKKLQRQALIERSQMLESLENLRTYGGQPDSTLMALLGDSVMQSSIADHTTDGAHEAAPALQQIGTSSCIVEKPSPLEQRSSAIAVKLLQFYCVWCSFTASQFAEA